MITGVAARVIEGGASERGRGQVSASAGKVEAGEGTQSVQAPSFNALLDRVRL